MEKAYEVTLLDLKTLGLFIMLVKSSLLIFL